MKVVAHPCEYRNDDQGEEVLFGDARGLRRHRFAGAVGAVVIGLMQFARGQRLM
jgi:hypothetical protein